MAVPLPLPVPAPNTVSQLALLVAAQPQLAVVVTATLPPPPRTVKFCVVGLSVKEQVSSSVMVRMAVLGVPSTGPPLGLLNARLTVSLPSTALSLQSVMAKVLGLPSPSAHDTVPAAMT